MDDRMGLVHEEEPEERSPFSRLEAQNKENDLSKIKLKEM